MATDENLDFLRPRKPVRSPFDYSEEPEAVRQAKKAAVEAERHEQRILATWEWMVNERKSEQELAAFVETNKALMVKNLAALRKQGIPPWPLLSTEERAVVGEHRELVNRGVRITSPEYAEFYNRAGVADTINVRWKAHNPDYGTPEYPAANTTQGD